MIKNITLALVLAFASAAGAFPLNYTDKVQNLPAGKAGSITDSAPTYALNMVTSTVASSAVDLSATGAIQICISGTAGTSPIVQPQFSNSSTASTFTNGSTPFGSGCWPLEAQGRYVRFVSVGTSLTAKTSLNYFVISAPPSNSTSTIAGTVTANQGTAGSVAWPISNSITALSSTTFALNTTSPTAISVVGITLTAQSGIFIDNSLGSLTICAQTGTSNTPPANTAGNYLYVPAGQQVLWLVGKEFLATDTKFYYGNNSTVTGTAKTTN